MTGYRYLVISIVLLALQACTSLPESKISVEPIQTSSNQTSYDTTETENEPITTSAPVPPMQKAAEELWPYLTARFDLIPAKNPADIEHFIDKYASMPRTLNHMLNNAKPYLAYVTEQLEQRQMPLELALLPMVESHYKPGAYSPHKAAGIWQFIPSTGKRYGLKQSWWYDGRRDIIASTDAALDYLQDLHQKMDGDWLKALAAYNCGEGRVFQAERRNANANRPTDFWSLDLPNETKEYVPRILALASLFKHADNYAIEFPRLHKSNTLQLVETQSQIDLERAAELAGLNIQELRVLNPGYLRNATDPDGPHYLLLPADKADLFSQKNATLSLAQRMPTPQKKGLNQHRIRKGETLWDIARRYDTSISALSKVNNISKRSPLKVGTKLIIPGDGVDRIQPKTVASKPNKTATHTTHRIRKGETLWDIARHYNTNINQLCQANNITKRSTLKIGQKLNIPASTTAVARNNTPVKDRWHRIRKGDTLWDIARLYDISVKDIRRANNLTHRKPLKVGYKLKIPGKSHSQGV